MPTREGALARATGFFDGGGFRDLLAGLVAVPSTSQEAGREAELDRYLRGAMRPWLERMGFAATIHPNPLPGFGPILTAERSEELRARLVAEAQAGIEQQERQESGHGAGLLGKCQRYHACRFFGHTGRGPALRARAAQIVSAGAPFS